MVLSSRDTPAHVAIATMLASRDSPGTFVVDLGLHVLRQVLPDIRALGLRREGYGRDSVLVLRDERALTRVPSSKQLRGGCRANQAGVRDSSETNTRNMAG